MKKLWTLLLTLVFVVGLISPAMTTTAYARNDVAMTVNGTEYTDHGKGWSAAVKLAKGGTDVTVKLFADWIADAENGFVCPDGGRKDGALYVGESKGKFTLDLNGCTIDRNASQEVHVSSVIYVEDCNFTVDDTSEEKDGKITGGHIDAGGGIYANDANLTLNGGNISGNKAENGAGVYLDDSKFTMNGGSITDNYATKFGGAVYVYCEDFTINGGVIARNHAVGSGGAIHIIGGDFVYHVYMHGGVIEDNSTDYKGGAVFVRHRGEFVMYDGIIRNNRAKKSGGAVSTEPPGGDYIPKNRIIIRGGTFTGNVTEEGNGGAIHSDVENRLYLSNCTITGNSAPFGRGGGVYIDTKHSDGIAFGGTVNITGNTAVTDRLDHESNVYIYTEDLSQLRHDYEDYGALNTDSKIGLTYGMVNLSAKTELNDGGNFTKEVISCFVLDDPYYTIVKEKRSNGNYDFYLGENPDYSVDNPCMTLETKESGKLNFGSLRRGWEYAIEQAENTDVIVTLHTDWRSAAGNYSYNEKSTLGGGLYIPRSCKKNITIDLNGYTIDRNLESQNVYLLHKGFVFYVDCAGSLTITDSSEAQTGTITGGKNAWLWGPLEARLNGCGGAFYVDYGTLKIKGGNITGNTATYGGAIYINDKDDAFVYISGGKIYGNTAEEGGAIYANNGYLYVDGGEITGNTATKYGGGIYWDSYNKVYLSGGKIYGNTATEIGGGIYAELCSQLFFGGDIQVIENANGNVYLKDDEGNRTGINNCCGQYGSPNKPLREGARIGILSSMENDMVSSGGSYFNERDFTYFFSDHSGYYIRSKYNPNVKSHKYVFEFTPWGDKNARYPRVKSVSVKNSELIENAELDYDTQTITITARNTKKNYFERISLYNLIDCTYDKDIYYLYDMGKLRDLREVQEYMIMSDNGTYVLCTVKVVPSGGAWADEQEDGAIPYAMTVSHEETKKEFIDPDEGWAYAVSQTVPVTITLFEHWVATNGEFTGSGTEDGCLYMDDKKLDITIDLNGYTIDRGLKAAVSDGQVFKIDDGTLTIKDSIGTGKITGGNTKGYGGAFLVEYGTLRIQGGEIKDNHAEYGGAIYCNDLDDAFIYIEGGKFVGNTASEDGGAIYMYDGYLEITDGEISGNTAKNGAGIYWESDNAAFLIGGKIINNNATVNGGVYVETDGDVYVGGDVTITGNGNGNLYLYNGAGIRNACGQVAGVPNKPLSEAARIGISANEKEEIISEDDSMFGEADFDVIFSDSNGYFIRSVYDAEDEGHEHKLYINSWGHEDARYPRVKTVSVKNSDMIESATIDYDEQIITLKVSANNKEALRSAALTNLISYTCDKDIYSIYGADEARDLTKAQEYKIISDNGTYVMVIVQVEWICSEHTDADNDGICDDCREYVFSDTTIIDYNAETREATVFITKPGRYSLIFADYENESLKNADIVEYVFNEGINVIPQEVASFTLANDDKVMLWYDMVNLIPICESLTLE